MHNCHHDILAHHDDAVTLPQTDQANMRNRRNANRDRLKKGLKNNERAAPREFKSQGSYAMKTMVQQPDNDYDIDDGVYFDKADLVGDRGAEMTALQTRQMVRDAIDDGSFSKAPEVRNNCVRVYYKAGYHVDLPVYRRVVDPYNNEIYHYELAASSWKRSDARNVTAWFEGENTNQSPDSGNGGQLRRVVRELKAFARSRDSWKGQILSGFGITKLVTECFRGDADRDDWALYDTMTAIRDRLDLDLVVKHPVTPNESITKDADDSCAKFFRERIRDAINNLAPLFDTDCTRKTALKCWDRVFSTTFFSDRLDLDAKTAVSAPSILTSGLLTDMGAAAAAAAAVRKEGGGRYA